MALGKDEKAIVETTSPADEGERSTLTTSASGHGAVEIRSSEEETGGNEIEASKGGWFAYLKTRDFYIVLALGYRLRLQCFELP